MAYNILNYARGLTAQAIGLVQGQCGGEGETLVREISGKWSKRALANQLFCASTLNAGTVIPVNAASLLSTFTIFNPVGSGVNLELVKYRLGLAGTTTAVIGSIQLAYQAAPAVGMLTTTSLGTIVSTQIGSGQIVPGGVTLLTSATFTGTPVLYGTLGLSFGTTGATPGPVPGVVDFDGEVVVPPNTAITIVGNVAQTQAMAQSMIFAAIPTTVG